MSSAGRHLRIFRQWHNTAQHGHIEHTLSNRKLICLDW